MQTPTQRVLLIEDSAELCSALKEYLQPDGYEIHVALEGEQALRDIAHNQFDLVAVDIFLPGRDGLEIIKELRQAYPGLPIIAISGGSDLDREMCLTAARQVGADAVLAKPFTPEDFKQALVRVAAGS